MKSFLMIGQSNMAGRGDFGEVPEINNKKCHMLRMGRWQRMSEPVNPDRCIWGDYHSGVGLAASFADRYAEYFGEDTGLIPCADGGTTISQWVPGGVLFDHAVIMTKLAMRTSELAGILYLQGETDSISFKPDVHKRKVTEMFAELRSQIGTENTPIIMGEIPHVITFGDKPRDPGGMNRVLHSVAEDIPDCGTVSSEGLELKPDGIHFSSRSCRILGERFFEKYLEIYKI